MTDISPNAASDIPGNHVSAFLSVNFFRWLPGQGLSLESVQQQWISSEQINET